MAANFARRLLFALALAALGPGCVVFNEQCSPMIKDPEDVTGWLGGDVNPQKGDVRTHDNSLGQLVAQTYYNAFPSSPPDFTFEDSGSVRSEGICETHDTVPKGPVKRKVLREVLPFDDNIVEVAVTHHQLKNILEHAIAGLSPSGTASPPGQFLQLWGGQVTADCELPAETLNGDGSRAQEGQRVTAISLLRRDGSTVQLDLNPPSDTDTVLIGTNNYLLGGGDGYVDLEGIDTTSAAAHYEQQGYNFEPIAAFFLATYTQQDPLPAVPPVRWTLTNCH